MLIWRRLRKVGYEPNSMDLAERMQIAARYAKSFDDFKEYMKLPDIK
jgi:hypothetical protein